MPIAVPSGVKVNVADGFVRVEGPKGKLARRLPPEVSLAVESGTVNVSRTDETRRARGVHGLTRKLVANMVEGASKGFTRVLEINGVGYRAEARGSILHLTLGYSHPIAYQLPAGISAKVERQVVITLEGADRELLDRSPPPSASCVRRSPTRARASSTRRNDPPEGR
jgi:large subunit ribosomal protein L6